LGKKPIQTRKDVAKRQIRIIDFYSCCSRLGHNPKKMLDVGFGNGALSEFFLNKGKEVAGVEINPEQVEYCKNQNPTGDFRLYNGTKLPFKDSSFDTIVMNDILEHISYKDIEILLPDLKRVLKPDGVIYISVMNRWQILEPHKLIPFHTWLPKRTWHPICKKLRGEDYIYYWPYTRKRLQKLLTRHNLRYQDMSDIYVQNKLTGKNPIGSKTTAKVSSFLKKFHLTKIAYILALRVTVLLYTAKIPKT